MNAELMQESWDRLIESLKKEIEIVKAQGNKLIPVIDFKDLIHTENGDVTFDPATKAKIQKVGVCVIRNVVPDDEARQLKYDLDEYIKKNPDSSINNPSMYQLYWSPSQLKGRSHPNVIVAQRALMGLWHSPISGTGEQLISTKTPLVYADRFRIRNPGDKMNLGPHIDGGFIGNWHVKEFARIYEKVIEGKWEEHDPFDYTYRLDAFSYQQVKTHRRAKGAFRMMQGWLSMSHCEPGGGTLQVNPMLKHFSAYVMMRPFFAPEGSDNSSIEDLEKHDPNVPWKFTGRNILEDNTKHTTMYKTHPHLQLQDTMISVPAVEPGDYVWWHCDTIHSVEAENNGTTDGSVLYIPAVPLTQDNLRYLIKQREAFNNLAITDDFPDGTKENTFAGVGTAEKDILCPEGLQAMGLGTKTFDYSIASSVGERKMLEAANKALFV